MHTKTEIFESGDSENKANENTHVNDKNDDLND